MRKGITLRSEDYSQWYLDVIAAAELADNSPVRGCIIIRPYGYAIWELIQSTLDRMLKNIGVQNAYFPLFIPESFLRKEAEHVEGFSPHLAVVTIGGGKKLEEALVVRPTSETIMYDSFSKWIKSYRDLPLIMNQWANVVRWEIRTRPFLRTTEFLWQEGHTAHALPEEAEQYALMILKDIYKKFIETYLAIPVVTGKKSEAEKFAGAKQTFTLEALMQDGKALQLGTAHDLSDNFAKSFNIVYLDKDGQLRHVHQTSWGMTTRLIGAILMCHSDDKGLILPPKIAPVEIVIMPITNESTGPVIDEAQKMSNALKTKFRVKIDDRANLSLGEKHFEWEKKGVPIRIEIGPKDIAKKSCMVIRRDSGEKKPIPLAELEENIINLLNDMQSQIFANALKRQQQTSSSADTWKDFASKLDQGGFVSAHWCEDSECEKQIQEKTKATSRCLPFDTFDGAQTPPFRAGLKAPLSINPEQTQGFGPGCVERVDSKKESGKHPCIHCGKDSKNNQKWVFAKAY